MFTTFALQIFSRYCIFFNRKNHETLTKGSQGQVEIFFSCCRLDDRPRVSCLFLFTFLVCLLSKQPYGACGRPKGVTSCPYKFLFLESFFRLFLRKNGDKMGEGGKYCVWEKQKTPLYNSLKKRCFFITAIHIFSIFISVYDLKFTKTINLTSISNSSHILIVQQQLYQYIS